jgi:hypothetical protein
LLSKNTYFPCLNDSLACTQSILKYPIKYIYLSQIHTLLYICNIQIELRTQFNIKMKRLFILALSLFAFSQLSSSAQDNVGIGTDSPDASALLELSSTSMGLLIPRMTEGERTSVASPATGLIVYQTNNATGFYYYDGSEWKLLSVGWNLTGNSGTDPSTDFIGTTDAQPFIIKTDDTERARFLSGGNFGIDNNSPSYLLDVNGTIRSGDDGADGELRIYSEQGGTDYEVVFQPDGSMTQNTTYTFPPDDGDSDQVLTTDGDGDLSWTDKGSGGGGGSNLWTLSSNVIYSDGNYGIGRDQANFSGNVRTQINFSRYGDTDGNYSTVSGGYDNRANANYATTSGGQGNETSGNHSLIAGGRYNVASGNYAIVTGGDDNDATGQHAFIGGGRYHEAAGQLSCIVGGDANETNNSQEFIGGGQYNITNARRSVICGGENHNANGEESFIGGGDGNETNNSHEFIGAGRWNTTNSSLSAIVGGEDNETTGTQAFIGGGRNHLASAERSVICGGDNNDASGSESAICGGEDNETSGVQSFIGGGKHHETSGQWSVVCGGDDSDAGGDASIIGAGRWNEVQGDFCGILAGRNNEITSAAQYSYIPAGDDNAVSGDYSTAFGRYCSASGNYTSAVGEGCEVSGNHSFAFGDNVDISDNYETAFYNGNNSGHFGINREDPDYPIHIGTGTGNGNGAYLTNGGTWTNGSSRLFKDRFKQLDKKDVLDKIIDMEICGWHYKNTREYHIWPFAEDFRRAFGTGDLAAPGSEKYLAAGDIAGVSLIGVQQLAKENKELKQRIANLEEKMAEYERQLAEYNKQDKTIEALKKDVRDLRSYILIQKAEK